jgi:hypothetical protein
VQVAGEGMPGIPYRTQQSAADAVAECRGQEQRQLRAACQRYATLTLLLQQPRVERGTDALGAGGEKLFEHAGIESSGRYRIDVYPIAAGLGRERFDQAHQACFGGGIGAQHRQRLRGATAR